MLFLFELIYICIHLVPGVIITAGLPSKTVGVSVEVFNPQTRHSCRLVDLPPGKGRYQHSLCSNLLCGGFTSVFSGEERSCLKLNPRTGVFSPTSIRLVKRRTIHVCWEVEGKGGPALLLGGFHSPNSTELVGSDGLTSSKSFSLETGI